MINGTRCQIKQTGIKSVFKDGFGNMLKSLDTHPNNFTVIAQKVSMFLK